MFNTLKSYVSIVLLLILLLCGIITEAAPYYNKQHEFKQPDGSTVSLVLNGDEFYIRAETEDGYTVTRDPRTGWICYAELSKDGSEFVSTGVQIEDSSQISIPADQKEKKRAFKKTLKKKLKVKTGARARKVKEKQKQLFGEDVELINGLPYLSGTTSTQSQPVEALETMASPSGTLPPTKNVADFNKTLRGLVLIFDFSDAPASYTIQQYANKVNKVNSYYSDGTAASLRTYYEDVSGGVFIMDHFVYGVFRAPNTFAYYDSLYYTGGAQELLSYGLNKMDDEGFDFSQLTTTSWGSIEALTVMYTGNPATWGEGMWYHAGWYGGFSADGVYTGSYCTDSANNLDPGTLIHEHGHMSAKWPDTYSYVGGEPGTWGIMGGGYCDLPNPYFLYENGWLDGENIMGGEGSKTMDSLDPHFAYFYYDPNQPTEFYMMRPYVNSLLYCPSIPDQGMTFWRINTEGDNSNYPNTNRHIELVHANNTDTNKHTDVCFKEGGLLDEFTPYTTPNTDWKFGVRAGEQSEMEILDVSGVDTEMTFFLGVPPEPIPYYPFNGSFNDVSSGVFDANAFNFSAAPWSGDIFDGCNFDLSQSLQFDGVDDYIVCPSEVATAENLTIAFWINPDLVGDMVVLDKFPADSSGAGWSIRLRQDGRVEFLIGSHSDSTSVISLHPVCEANRWAHVTCTYSDGVAKIYINGVIRMIKKGISQSPNTTALEVQMGIASQVDTDWIYQGRLDDVRFYDFAMDVDPLNAMDGLDFILDHGVLAYLKMDETIGTSASDGSGNNHDAQLVNTDFGTSSGGGKIGSAVYLDGIDDYLEISGFNDRIQGLTVSMWIKADDWNGNRRILQKGSDGGDYRLLIENGLFVFQVGSSRMEVSALPATGRWVYITATCDGSMMRVYYDTVEKGALQQTGTVTNISNTLYIGTKNAAGIPGDHFKGAMDDIRIYNYGLSIAEIIELYENNRMDVAVAFNGASDVSTESILRFVPAANAMRHDIYFGTEYNAVQNADPLSREYVGRKRYSEYNPPALDVWREYFWRVDEILLDGTIQTGPVWRFSTAGGLQRQVWTNLSGTAELTGLTGSADYPDNPSLVTHLDSFEIPTDWDDSYGSRVYGVLVPQTTGSYRFWISGDDEVELWLSSNADPLNASLIAYIHGVWTEPLNFDQYASQESSLITLQAGQPYYIMALHKEGYGGDHMAVAWQGPDSPAREIIDGFWLRPLPKNEWPVFESEIASLVHAIEGTPFNATLPSMPSDPDSANVSYEKQAGPEWLTVSTSGQLSGIPTNEDVGNNSIIIRAYDGQGGYDEIIQPIQVENRFTGAMGMEDLLNFSGQWLNSDSSSPADLDQIEGVNLEDYSLFSSQWNTGLIDGLVGHWPLDDAFGLTARDHYGPHNGSLINMTEYNWIMGVSNNALAFDGVNDYVEITGYPGVLGSHARTCCAWIKTSASTWWQDIIGWGKMGVGQRWLLTVTTGGALQLEVIGGYQRGSTVINDGQWHHVAAVFENDGTPDVSDVKLYIDGVEETAYTSAPKILDTIAERDVCMGLFDDGYDRFFNGLIDDVRIYDRALSPSEIQGLQY